MGALLGIQPVQLTVGRCKQGRCPPRGGVEGRGEGGFEDMVVGDEGWGSMGKAGRGTAEWQVGP